MSMSMSMSMGSAKDLGKEGVRPHSNNEHLAGNQSN